MAAILIVNHTYTLSQQQKLAATCVASGLVFSSKHIYFIQVIHSSALSLAVAECPIQK